MDVAAAPAAGTQEAPAIGVTPSGPSAEGGAPAPASTAWYSKLDADTQGWLENKGLKLDDPSAVLPKAVDGFRNAEKFVGVPADELVRVPKETDAEGWAKVFNKLGRPAEPKDYDLAVPEGGDPNITEWAKATFHEAGLTAKQARIISEKFNGMTQGRMEQNKEVYAANIARETEALKAEWGAAYDQNINVARQATRAFGLDTATIDKLEGAFGFAGLMKFMINLGGKIGEDKFHSGEGSPGFGALTPGQAMDKLSALKSDPQWSARYLAGAAAEKAEMDRLMKMAYPS